MSYTRLEYFLGTLENLGERIDVTATDNASSALTFTSTDGFSVPSGAYDGREVWYVTASPDSQANLGTTRRITSTNPAGTGEIAVNVAWPSTPQAGDVIALANFKSMSARVHEIHNKINALIDRVADEMAPPEVATSETFNSLSPTIAYPDDWDWILGAQWQEIISDGTGRWRPLYEKDLDHFPWDGVVQIKNVPREKLTGFSVRLIGATRLQPLMEDNDRSIVPKAWLCMQAAAELKREAAIRRGDAATDLTIANMMLADAQAMRSMVSRQYRIEGGFRWSTYR
jgi:hypothetical protein